mmetsp:Transcript_23308/g.54130  ORF Transcript_23308/g.54130 Transcript_23308/m.54130 type:complete len:134 (-) Transcript_23308:985-1386(-)
MVLAQAVGTAARRHLQPTAVAGVQRRAMGSGPKPEWTGIDKVVRTYFPEDWQLAAAIIGGYGSLVVIAQIRSAFSKKKPAEAPAAPAAPAAAAATGAIPAIDSPEFATFVESEAFSKLLESEEQLSAMLADMK